MKTFKKVFSVICVFAIVFISLNLQMCHVLAVTPNGLLGQYYNGQNFDTYVASRIDSNINFNWGSGSPMASINYNDFTVRWTGQVQPLYSETYTFTTYTDDGVKLWINGQLIIDQLAGIDTYTGTISLQAGKKYDLKMEFKEHLGSAFAYLKWSSASQPLQVIPPEYLFQPETGIGLLGEYYNGQNFNTYVTSRIDSTVAFDWSSNSPAPSVYADDFTVRWTGQVRPLHTETYTFTTTTDDGVRLWVNGQLLIDKFDILGGYDYSGTISLEAGKKYDIKMEYKEHLLYARAYLKWSSANQPLEVIPQSCLFPYSKGNGLLGQYYNGQNFETFVTSRIDSTVAFDWSSNPPAPSVNADDFTIRWTGKVQPKYTGAYTFTTTTDDGVRLWVNGQLLIDQFYVYGGYDFSGTINLEAGKKYDIKMEFREHLLYARAYLKWSCPSQSLALEVIPQESLFEK